MSEESKGQGMTNRGIDALVAEKVFGLVRVLSRNRTTSEVSPTEYFRPAGDRDAQFVVLPRYSADPAASDQLLDRMAELGWMSIITSTATRQHTCVFHRDEPKGSMGYATSDSRKYATALAALAALGVEVPA